MNSIKTTPVKNEKRYKCPYCESRIERSKLSNHIEKTHKQMIPQGYTASRVAFNTMNHKEVGHCIICGNDTDWNEDKKRYERLCNSPACKKAYIKMTEDRLKKARGVSKSEMLSDPNFQDKMLKGRSISGTYKFSDGGKLSYVGSYERNFLEFMDKFLHVKSEDIQSPGPTIEYYYEGKKHFWITDFYYIPYNLVLDIKDGGKNPNNREMVSYRAKQYTKEKAITDGKQYNYIRLTDNQFDQLLDIMLELKDSLAELEGAYNQELSRIKPIIKINEGCIKILDKYKDPKLCSWDEELTYKTIEDALVEVKDKSGELYVYDMDLDTYEKTYLGSIKIDGDQYEWVQQEAILADTINNTPRVILNNTNLAGILYTLLSDIETYKNRDLDKLRLFVEQINDEYELLNIYTYITAALEENNERWNEYSNYLDYGKSNHITQPDCELFKANNISLDDISYIGKLLKDICDTIITKLKTFSNMDCEQLDSLSSTLNEYSNLTEFDLNYFTEYVL